VVGEPIRFTPRELDPASCGGDERVLYQHLSDRVMEAIAGLQLPESLQTARSAENLTVS
jgi:hypothetical protein